MTIIVIIVIIIIIIIIIIIKIIIHVVKWVFGLLSLVEVLKKNPGFGGTRAESLQWRIRSRAVQFFGGLEF